MRVSIFLLFLSFFTFVSCEDDNNSRQVFDSLKKLYNYNVETMDRMSRCLDFMPIADGYIFGTEEERVSLEEYELKGYEISDMGSNAWCFTLKNIASYVIEHGGSRYNAPNAKWLVDYVDSQISYEEGYDYCMNIMGNTKIEIVCLDLNNKGVQGKVINIRDNVNTTIFRVNLAVNVDTIEGSYFYEGNSEMSMYDDKVADSYNHKYIDCKTSIIDADNHFLGGNIVIDRADDGKQLAEIKVLSTTVIINSMGEEIVYDK